MKTDFISIMSFIMFLIGYGIYTFSYEWGILVAFVGMFYFGYFSRELLMKEELSKEEKE